MQSETAWSYFTRSETWDMNAVIEASSVIVPPDTFPFCSSFSFDEATLGPLTTTGEELEEFPTVEAYNAQSMVTYGKIFSI